MKIVALVNPVLFEPGLGRPEFFAVLDRVAIVEDAGSALFILAGAVNLNVIIWPHDSEPSLPYLNRFNIITTFQIPIVSFKIYPTFLSEEYQLLSPCPLLPAPP